jgi:hypothetical protein
MVKLADGTITELPDLVRLRDRTLISVMTYAFGRIRAVLGRRVEDYYPQLMGATARKGRQMPRDAGTPPSRSSS